MKNLCIVGLGMIGGSLAAALKQVAPESRITALVRSPSTGERGLELGYIDAFDTEARALIPESDIIMLAVPMLSMREQLQAIQPWLSDQAIITDAGSVKAPFIEDARAVLQDLSRVVPGHPVAGREKTGVDAADATLYQNRRVLLTPIPETDPTATEAVSELWQAVGAEVECLAPEHHDRVLAATSHLPHVLAFALVDMLATQQESEEIFRYSAGGFRDFTRIASSDARMWRDVCLTNRTALLDAMDKLELHLRGLRDAIDRGDGQCIEQTFDRARRARDRHTGQ